MRNAQCVMRNSRDFREGVPFLVQIKNQTYTLISSESIKNLHIPTGLKFFLLTYFLTIPTRENTKFQGFPQSMSVNTFGGVIGLVAVSQPNRSEIQN